jgi:hypothetical protein
MRRQRVTGLPVTVVMCRPCRQAGKRRKLLEFDLGPGGPSQSPYTDDGKRVLPRWSGPDDGGKVHRTCSCGNHVQVSRTEILKALGEGVPVLWR